MSTLENNQHVIKLSRASREILLEALEQYAYDNQKNLSEQGEREVGYLLGELAPHPEPWAVMNMRTGALGHSRHATHEGAQQVAEILNALGPAEESGDCQAYYIGEL